MPAAAVAERFIAAAREPPVRMAYARLAITRAGFLENAIRRRPTGKPRRPDVPPARRSAAYTVLSRSLFRQQTGSESGKAARWYAETVLLPPRRDAADHPQFHSQLSGVRARRNQMQRIDILHEYFIPPARFGEFLAACRELIPPSKQELLNVTLRFVDTDPVSVLTFAPAPRIAAVLLFTQGVTREADARHAIAHAGAHRPRARARRQLLSAIPFARAARTGEGGLSAPRRISRKSGATIRSYAFAI